jgi:hypothetical protein
MPTDLHEPTRHDAPPVRRSGLRTFALAALGTVVGLLAVALLAVAAVTRFWPEFVNPFATDTVDRTGPAVVQALEDLSEYRAATGSFQVILDVEDDARFVPQALLGERTLFVAVGSVDAFVDFSGLDEEAITFSTDPARVAIVLPGAELSEPRVDPERSYVYERRRGLLNRIGSMFSDDPTSERELYLLAQERLAAAAAETDLRAVAERNTREMLRTLLSSLGFTDIAVTFR